MIGERLHSSSESPWIGPFLFGIGITLVLLGLAIEVPGCIFASFAFFLLGLIFVLTRKKGIEFILERDGIDVLLPRPEFIPYRAIEMLSFPHLTDPERDRFFDIQVAHEQGVLLIPPSVGVESRSLYDFLQNETKQGRSDQPVPNSLRDHYEEQIEEFGLDRVWSFRARSRQHQKSLLRGWLLCLGLFLLGILWIVVAVQLDDKKKQSGAFWGSMGGLCIFASFIVMIIMAVKSGQQSIKVTNRRASGMVISPVGLALVQGDLKGELRWDEIKNIQWVNRGQILQLTVAGAQIKILDIYTESLPIIHDILWMYWKPPTRSVSGDAY